MDGNGGDLYNENSIPLIYNMLFVGEGENCAGGPISSAGSNNLSDDESCTGEATPNLNPGKLGNYGGNTLTIPLLAGSSAIDTGSDRHCPETDQRGEKQDGTCDVGAFEYHP